MVSGKLRFEIESFITKRRGVHSLSSIDRSNIFKFMFLFIFIRFSPISLIKLNLNYLLMNNLK